MYRKFCWNKEGRGKEEERKKKKTEEERDRGAEGGEEGKGRALTAISKAHYDIPRVHISFPSADNEPPYLLEGGSAFANSQGTC